MTRSGALAMMLPLMLVLFALPQPVAADKPIIVGDGTAASCTETPLQSALLVAAATGGGTIKFNCGGGPVTITLTATLIPSDHTTIDGDGLITLDGGARDSVPPSTFPTPGVTVVSVDSTATVVLKNLVISGGFGAENLSPFLSFVGGIHNEGTLTVKHITFSDNFGQAGAIANFGTLTVNNSRFSRGDGFDGTGGIHNEGTLTINNSTFSDNRSIQFGGIANFGTLTVNNSTFSDNIGDLGGGISNFGTLTVDNSTFSGNRASVGAGGGIYNDGTLTVKNSTFSDNHGFFRGGGIFSLGTLTIKNSTFSGNLSISGGGLSTYTGSFASVTDSKFSGNFGTEGGAISNYGTLKVANSRVSDNFSGHGGGIFNAGTLALDNSTITHNTADLGGGIYICVEGQVSEETFGPCHGVLSLKHTIVTENTPDNIFP
jgi:hypothetical protein